MRVPPAPEGALLLLEKEKRVQPIISLNAVTKIYAIGSTRLRALDGVTLDIYPGEFTCIVGRSGSGKSTLLNMIAGLEKPTKGQIRVAGRQINRMNEAKLVQFRLDNVGFVFQQFNLFATHTALDNVAMPLMYKGVPRDARLRSARAMLDLVGLASHMKHMPTQMSGGQQQRVGIARSLVTRPKILFADEPTGNLDLRTSREILRLIRSVCRERGTTLIMVTHDAEIAEYADRIVKLLDGRVIENLLQENPKEIALVQTLPDGTVVEIPEGEAASPGRTAPMAGSKEDAAT
jgi:putative ABC transport system ATP-binding protein